jgi:RNA polymerase sigma factor (sigma-70 family)
MSQPYTDRQCIDALRTGGRLREAIWRYITESWSGYCRGAAVRKTGCTDTEVREAFSMACVGVDKRIRTTVGYDFLAKASLKTYLTSATIRAAWTVMSRRKKYPDDERLIVQAADGEDPDTWYRQKDCREIMEKALSNLGERCKKILILFKDGFGMKEIMTEMGFGNEDVAKTEKWQCQEKFKKYLRANPDVKSLLIENCYG